ncbi:DUF6766 family protein [Microbacterium aureliae]
MTRSHLRDHALSLAFLAIFVVALFGQSIAGLAQANQDLADHDQPVLSWGQFVTSSEFFVDIAENWQSEFLQFALFILGTIWLVQRGSPESKEPGQEGLESDEEQKVGAHAGNHAPAWARQRGIRGWVYANSLLLAMVTIFVLSWLAQSLAGLVVFNDENAHHGSPLVTWGEYLVSPDFWSRTLQNWQSEFLAVGTMVAFTIYLRQRGSSESKPVGVPHLTSGVEG